MKKALANQPAVKARYLRLHPDFILELLKIDPKGEEIDGRLLIECIEDCIPESATAIGSNIDDEGYVLIYITHESFEEISEHLPMRQMIPRYTKTIILKRKIQEE